MRGSHQGDEGNGGSGGAERCRPGRRTGEPWGAAEQMCARRVSSPKTGVDGGEDERAALQADGGDQDEPRGEGAEDAAERIEPEDVADGGAEVIADACAGLRGEQEGDAHEDAGDEA